jgi:hypothetical protein
MKFRLAALRKKDTGMGSVVTGTRFPDLTNRKEPNAAILPRCRWCRSILALVSGFAGEITCPCCRQRVFVSRAA